MRTDLHEPARYRPGVLARAWPVGVALLVALLAIVLQDAAQGASESAAKTATVWAVGDGDAGDASRRVVDLIERDRPDRLLYLGDVYEHGSAADFAANFAPTFGRLARLTAPTPGNHEWGLRAEGYGPYWSRAMRKPVPDFYTLKLAGWEILSLNSEAPHDGGSAQVRWLRSQLRPRGTCRLAFWHRPRYSSGGAGDQADIAPLWSALRGKAALVVTGHDHNMQRLEPRDGLVSLIAGSGGHESHRIWKDPRVAFANNTDFGALRLKLTAGLARHAFVAADGRRLDSGSVKCRPLDTLSARRRRAAR